MDLFSIVFLFLSHRTEADYIEIWRKSGKNVYLISEYVYNKHVFQLETDNIHLKKYISNADFYSLTRAFKTAVNYENVYTDLLKFANYTKVIDMFTNTETSKKVFEICESISKKIIEPMNNKINYYLNEIRTNFKMNNRSYNNLLFTYINILNDEIYKIDNFLKEYKEDLLKIINDTPLSIENENVENKEDITEFKEYCKEIKKYKEELQKIYVKGKEPNMSFEILKKIKKQRESLKNAYSNVLNTNIDTCENKYLAKFPFRKEFYIETFLRLKTEVNLLNQKINKQIKKATKKFSDKEITDHFKAEVDKRIKTIQRLAKIPLEKITSILRSKEMQRENYTIKFRLGYIFDKNEIIFDILDLKSNLNKAQSLEKELETHCKEINVIAKEEELTLYQNDQRIDSKIKAIFDKKLEKLAESMQPNEIKDKIQVFKSFDFSKFNQIIKDLDDTIWKTEKKLKGRANLCFYFIIFLCGILLLAIILVFAYFKYRC